MAQISTGRGQLIYLAHASEDKPVVRAVGDALKRRGWNIWLDEAELLVGPSLRSQLDEGMARSRFGIVFLSPNFFAKRWPKVELDALFTMEDDGLTRMLPVNLGMDRAELVRLSPITASLFSASFDGDPHALADRLSETMGRVLADEGSFVDQLRIDVVETLPWEGSPNFYDDSMSLIDEGLDQFIGNDRLEFSGHPDSANVAGVVDLVERAPQYNGRPISIIGLQHTPQLLRDYDKFGDWVFQLSDPIGSTSPFACYIRYFGPPAHSGYVPNAPENHFSIVLGVVLARGPMRTIDGYGTGVYAFGARVTVSPYPTD